ncbi:MAG: hypothetical protein L0312_03565 [Acidobacteria bacterium]|nr:hypothetical protein [Acidobacteriota bacterium]
METLLLFLMIAIALYLLLPVFQGCLIYVSLAGWRIWAAARTAGEGIQWRAFVSTQHFQRTRRMSEFQKWLRTRIGSEETDTSINQEILQAHRQAPRLRRLVEEEVPKTIGRCLKVHQLTGRAAQASYFYQIAYEPECFGLRQRVADLVGASVQMLEEYPLILDDPILLQNLIVMRSRILPTCQACPYLECAVQQAPALCPAAEIAGIRPENCVP